MTIALPRLCGGESFGVYKGNGRETLRGCVTILVIDENGNTIAIEGHKLDGGADVLMVLRKRVLTPFSV